MQKIINNLKIHTGSMLEFFVLKMLSDKTHSITEISEDLRSTGFKIPMGSIYPLMTRLRRKGYVISGYEEGDTTIAVKTYDLTNSIIASIGSR